jgi:hypothetical protein
MPDYTPPSGGTSTSTADADANTKIQVEESADENKIRFDTAGSERMIIDETGKVGIGTSSPASALEVSGTTTDVALTVVNDKSTALDNSETATLRLQCNQGTDSDFEIVHDVFGHTTLYSNQPNSGTNAHIKFTNTPAVVINPNSMDMDFQVASDSVSNMLYVNGGTDSVGIGTNSPSSRLEVQGGLTTTGAVLTLSTMETTVVANDVLGRINFQAPLEASGTDAILPGASIHALATDTFAADNNETAIVLSTASSDAEGTVGGGLNERMRITSAGNVGIGTSSPTEMLHLSDADASEPTLLLENTGTSTSEPNLMFRRSGSHPSDPTVDIGRIAFEGDNTNDENILYAAITGDAHVATDGDERGRMRFHVMRAGAITEILRIGGYEISINEGGGDVNFRVEGASDSSLLVVDAGTDRVGIGTSAPNVALDVQGSARFRASVEVCTSDPAPANIETGTIYQFTKGSAGVFTLPASPPVGTQFVLVNGSANDIVITRPHSSVKINGATSNATNTTAYAATSIVAVVSNGDNSEWLVFGGI